MVLANKVSPPIAVLKYPVVLAFKAPLPTAVLLYPDVFEVRAVNPIAVLEFDVVLVNKRKWEDRFVGQEPTVLQRSVTERLLFMSKYPLLESLVKKMAE